MSYSNEQYPSVIRPIHFKPHDDIVNNPNYPLRAWPSLERPRQPPLTLHSLGSWKLLPRDYCIVRYPRNASQQNRDLRSDLHVEIFHTDVVNIPDDDIGSRFQENKNRIASYWKYWHLQGMTRSNVEKIFKKYFELSIPSVSTSAAGHWMPVPKLYTVEILENVWEERVALFFDSNIETPSKSVGLFGLQLRDWREYGDILKTKGLDDLYVRIWRSKWERLDISDESLAPSESGGTSTKSTNTTLQRNEAETNVSAPKPRGRKRRAALRQLRTRSSKLNSSKIVVDQLADSTQSAISIPPAVRGRLRRRDLRKNKSNTKQFQSTPVRENQYDSTALKSSDSAGNDVLDPKNFDAGGWEYDSGEIGSKNNSHKGPARLVIDFGIGGPKVSGHNFETDLSDLDDNPGLAFTPRSDNIPVLTIRPLLTSPPLLKAKRFHLMSYFNPTSLSPKTTISDKPNDGREIDTEEKAKAPIPDVQPYEIHIADLIDEASAVSENGSNLTRVFFSIIEANPSTIPTSKGFLSTKFSTLSPSQRDRNRYWHKFSSLLYGFADGKDTRKLPYSHGYGVKHNIPILVVKQNRWGYFDVDNVCRESRRPRWRASWRFETMNGSDLCGCNQHKISHDLRSCSQLSEDQLAVSTGPWGNYSPPDQILPNLLQFVHKPYETLSVLELHKYYPPLKHTPHDLGSGNISKNPGDDEPIGEDEKRKMLGKQAERQFEKGVCSLMGLGVPKNITVGIQLIRNSAEQGSKRARAMGRTIAGSYGVEFKVPSEVLESWLREASIHGSRTALEELRSRFPGTYSDVVFINRFASDLSRSEVFNYPEHVLPHFDLSDVSLLEHQIKSFKLEEGIEIGSTASLSAMVALERRGENASQHYYFLGSLLHLSCLFGFLEATAFLLDHGFDIDAQNTHHVLRTPILCALNRGYSAIAKLLISRGASCEPLMFWSSEDILHSTPSPLHYLVNIKNDNEAKELARLLVKSGSDVNCKCETRYLISQTPTEIPILKGRSVTPLRWAIIHRKSQLVKVLLSLGAKFAFEKYLRHPNKVKEESHSDKEGYLLLETPCTDLDILEMFFARARVPGLPTEFSQTPLGLLVSEDDGPERRLRPGFESFGKIKDALDLLLELQPGHEDVLLWSAVRHDHIDIVRYLVEEREFSIESRWRGLTMLHTAVLYGRVELVRYLLGQGADLLAVTDTRRLTCLHLLMLVPRDPTTDRDIMDCIWDRGIDIDAREASDCLTALHLAVRNQKSHFIKALLDMGADPSIPVSDQLYTIVEGKTGLLSHSPQPPQIFTPNLTIIGEVIVQYLQDKFYPYDYVADLLLIFLDRKPKPLTSADLIIDSRTSITLLHLLSLIIHPSDEPYTPETQWNSPPPPPPEDTAPISLLQLVLLRCSPSSIKVLDSQNDTPLHYACAAHNVPNIQTLLSFGSDPTLINKVGLNPVDVLLWSTFFIKGKTLTFYPGMQSWHPRIDYSLLSSSPLSPSASPVKHSSDQPSDLFLAVKIFQEMEFEIDERLRALVLAWDWATNEKDFSWFRRRGEREFFELVPEESARGIKAGEEGEGNPDSKYKANGKYDMKWQERIKRPYWVANLRGAVRVNGEVPEIMFGYGSSGESDGE